MNENRSSETLLKELREAVKSGKGNYGHRLLCGQAADEIERLQAEVAKLNRQLDRIDKSVERWQRNAYNTGATDGFSEGRRYERGEQS